MRSVSVALMMILFVQGEDTKRNSSRHSRQVIIERNKRYSTIGIWDAKCHQNEGFVIERQADVKMCLFWGVTRDFKIFSAAKADCQAKGARLGVFKGSEKMTILKRKGASVYRHIWIGLDDINTEGTFVWHDGTILPPSEYRPLYFAENRPDDAYGADCVHYSRDLMLLDDSPCYYTYNHVCEKLIS
ncbi:CD209 antigen [Biomphalaria pfeifferi]|uniref:CD209 antigen n=1 Tax=Biomphalaria pfeifferi TaxID=112525 RepID=A0AAD8F6S3_BIOPF|nr:CD209 antigen [Biomphalaria pfeifferi]